MYVIQTHSAWTATELPERYFYLFLSISILISPTGCSILPTSISCLMRPFAFWCLKVSIICLIHHDSNYIEKTAVSLYLHLALLPPAIFKTIRHVGMTTTVYQIKVSVYLWEQSQLLCCYEYFILFSTCDGKPKSRLNLFQNGSYRMCRDIVHMDCSYRMFRDIVHMDCSYRMCRDIVHMDRSYRMCRDIVHMDRSYRMCRDIVHMSSFFISMGLLLIFHRDYTSISMVKVSVTMCCCGSPGSGPGSWSISVAYHVWLYRTSCRSVGCILPCSCIGMTRAC